MRARSLPLVWWLLVAVLLGCSPAPMPSPTITPPPVPVDLVPWPDIVWSPVDAFAGRDPGLGEQIVAMTVSDEGFVAVGWRERGAIRDGSIWYSPDGRTWQPAGAPDALEGVEIVDVAPAPGGFMALGIGTFAPAADRLHAVFLSSPDGRAWDRLTDVPGSEDTYPEWLTGGPEGVLASGSDADGGPAVWRSDDGQRFRRVNVSGPAGGIAIVDPHVADDGHVALGSQSVPPMLLRSTDGEVWTSTDIDSDPDVVAVRLVPGRWGFVVQGIASEGCSGMASCPGQSIGWWSGDGTGWARLPSEGTPIGNGGSLIVAAGEHGVVAIDGASAWESPDGWAWRPLPPPGDGTMVVSDAVVRGDMIVAGGSVFGDDGISRAAIVVASPPTED